jgi:hypothetical protein
LPDGVNISHDRDKKRAVYRKSGKIFEKEKWRMTSEEQTP